ncbi:SusC/RagA family TonB-linked outer membrane protein [Polaribacter sp. M15]
MSKKINNMKFRYYILILFVFLSGVVFSQSTITGVVTDKDKIPLPGVSVIIKGSAKGESTDFDGKFSIKASPNDIIQFAFLGFATKEVKVGNQTLIKVILEESTEQLEEIVVIGYGTSNKKELVSSVSSIKGDALENQPVSRVDQALQGRAAGVEVVSNSGAPGAGATIRIRGNSSINGNNNPLFVIDGFIVGTGFNLNNINVNDIESIEVLKDATALSIYGTRGAAGVILVTTKSGKGLESGKPSISINMYTSIDQVTNEIDILDGNDYVNYVNEAGQFTPGTPINFGGLPIAVGRTDTSLPQQYDPSQIQTTDWLDLVTQQALKNNFDISIRGNSENINYYSSINYFSQEGLLRNSGIDRFIFRNNMDINITSKLKAGFRLNVTRQKRENNKINYGNIVSSVLPIRSVYDDNGNFTAENPISGSLQRNPIADLELRVDHDLVTNIIANSYFEYEIIKDLKWKSSFGATLNYFKNNRYLPGLLPERLDTNLGGEARVQTNQSKNLLQENTITYKKTFDKHSLNVLGGFTWQKINNESVATLAGGFPFDVIEFNGLGIGSDPETYQVDSGFSQRTLLSYLARLTYSYDQKYVLTLAGRYDGSSVFEDGSKYAFFPSVGVAWNIDEESFMKDLELINRFKVRGSFGIVGEQGISPFNSFDRYNPTFNYFNENLYSAVLLGSPASRGLVWETTEQLDLGLEIGFLQNRINFEAGYYRKVTKDLLLNTDIPNTAGIGRLTRNIGSVQNQGVELLLNSVNVRNNNFKWTSSLSVSANRSKVLDLGDEEIILLQNTGNQGNASAALIVGQPFPVFIGAEYLGTYQDPQQIIDDNRIGRSFLGSPRFRDLNGDGTINNQDALTIGSPEADFFGGLRNTFTYKGFSLDVFFQGSYGNEVFNVLTQTSYYGRGDQNLDPRVLNRWREGIDEVSNIPRAGTSTSVFNPNSTVNVEDGSFLRLRTVSLSYDLPIKNTPLKDVVRNINLYVIGNNLALFSKFSLGDPEVNNFSSGSGFNSVSQGFASGQYPYARSILTGVKIEF